MAHNRTSSRDLYPPHQLQQQLARNMDVDYHHAGSTTRTSSRRKSSLGAAAAAAAAAANWAEDAGHFETGKDDGPAFFIPSYLRGSRHADRLRRAHEELRAKAQEQQRQQQQQQQHGTSGGKHQAHYHSGGARYNHYPPLHPTASSSSVSLPRHHHITAAAAGGATAPSSSSSHRRNSSGVYLARSSGSNNNNDNVMQDHIVERAPPAVHESTNPDSASLLAPLPTRLNDADKHPMLDLLAGGSEVRFTGPPKGADDGAAVRADHAIPRAAGVYYFEATILSRSSPSSSSRNASSRSSGDPSIIALGFCSAKTSLARMPGWEPDSWAFHADDGMLYTASSTAGRAYGPKCYREDVLGCGLNFRTGTAFFTRNGTSLGTAFGGGAAGGALKFLNAVAMGGDAVVAVYPCVGMKKAGEHVRVNFGQTPFVFDIERVVAEERAAVAAEISRVDLRGLLLSSRPVGGGGGGPADVREAEAEEEVEEAEEGEEDNALLQDLVAQYLAHEGYVETARAFSQDVVQQAERQQQQQQQHALLDSIPPTHQQQPSSTSGRPRRRRRARRHHHLLATETDDIHALARQRIRRHILDGDIDRALAATRRQFPAVLALVGGGSGDAPAPPPPQQSSSSSDGNNLLAVIKDSSGGGGAMKTAAGTTAAASAADVVFRLRCRKFVEMMRRYMALQEDGGEGESRRSSGDGAEDEDEDGEDEEEYGERGSSPVTVTKSVPPFVAAGVGSETAAVNVGGGVKKESEDEDDDDESEDDEEENEEEQQGEDDDVGEEEGSSEEEEDDDEQSTQMELDDQFHREAAHHDHSRRHRRRHGGGGDIDMTTSQDLASMRQQRHRHRRRPSQIKKSHHDAADTHTAADGSGDSSLAAILAYGQQLSRDYLHPRHGEKTDTATAADDEPAPAVKKHLDDIFSIMAYRRIADSPVAHLFDVAGRTVLAEEVNALILASLGKPAHAALERLVATTEVLLDETACRVGGAAALVNVRRDFLQA